MRMNRPLIFSCWKALVSLLLVSFALTHATSVHATGGPVVDVWYGSEQNFSQIGLAQQWVNILGNASDPDGVSSLTYSLNGGMALPLSMGPFRRLDRVGDFNVELDSAELIDGTNLLVITATDSLDNVTQENVTINFEAGNIWPMPFFTNWSAITHIQDAAQIVDGLWALESDHVRPVELGYDRILAIGDIQWTDFEVVVPITIHGIDPGGFAWPSVAPAVATTLRWQGHAAWDDSQPRWGYFPIGAGPWYEFHEDGSGSLRLQGDSWSTSDPAARVLAYDVSYLWKTRVQTLPSGVSQYSFKLWEDGQPEPEGWDITGQESGDLPGGSLLLIAHEVDASFGDVSIAPILEIGDVQVDHGDTDAAVAWVSNVPATSRVDYGLTDSYELGYVEDASLVTQHNIPLSGLTPGLTYYFRVSSTIIAGIESSLTGRFRAGLSSIESDDFHTPVLNTERWTFIDPLEDSTLTMTGMQALISIPATGVAHNAWTDVYTVPRLMQSLEGDTDFEVEAKFESWITADPQMHGITIEQDGSNFLRVEFQDRGGYFRVFVASVFGGSSEIHISQTITQDVPMYLQVRRLLDFWTVLYSYDGESWVTACTFTQDMTVTAVGVYAGNGPSAPHTVLIDYFFNAASPIDPEDGTEEICGNGIDDDGDDFIDNRDFDEDGYIDEACGGADCDDTDADVNPDGTEVCDGVDNNCADGVDEEPLASAFCDNGLFCDGDESCSSGSCQAGADPCPDDGLFCNGTESCDEGGDQCTNTGDPCPDDGLYCSGTESCDEGGDQCVSTGDPCPDDGLWCNGSETCDETGDQCDAVNVPDCADAVGCTVDTCNEATDSCDNTADDALCDDGQWCNGSETCDETFDCQTGVDVVCDDEIPCTEDYCDDENDQCDVNDFCAAIDVDPVCPGNAMSDDDITVSVLISDGSDVDALGLDLSYDAGVLEYAGFSTLDCLLDEWAEFNCEESPGVISCDGLSEVPLPSESSGCLFSLDFTVLPGTSGFLTYLSITGLLEDLFLMSTAPCSTHIGECMGDGDCDDGLFCNGEEACEDFSCEAGAEPCPSDENDCSDDLCDEDDDVCEYLCNAVDYQDPCCEDPACSGDPICEAPECMDGDGDGFGYPGAPSCPDTREDCDDTDPNVNPGMQGQDCVSPPDNVDNDCDGQVDEDDCGDCFIGIVM